MRAAAGLVADLGRGFALDARRYGPAAALRLLRACRASPSLHRDLRLSDSRRRHEAALGGADPVFYLAHREYLARGLSPQARAEAALAHYRSEDARPAAWREAVYGPGLGLWRAEVAGVAYDIRLVPGQDVMIEGGLSVVLFVDGGRVCVLSFSLVPAPLVAPDGSAAGPDGLLPFVARKQLARDHGYQAAFNKAFDRATPAHLCMGALGGVMAADGRRAALGVDAARHPVASADNAGGLAAAYEGFWRTMAGRPAPPFGTLVDLPVRFGPVEGMDAKRRRRALQRRARVEAVAAAAGEAARLAGVGAAP